jgi:hypothetical protein
MLEAGEAVAVIAIETRRAAMAVNCIFSTGVLITVAVSNQVDEIQ